MKSRLLILLLFSFFLAKAQPPELKEAVQKLDLALVQKDTTVLNQLLDPKLVYGHSNGWEQTKAEVIRDMVSGKLAYTRIDTKERKWTIGEDYVLMRCDAEVNYQLNGTPGELKLHIMQVWKLDNHHWQLIARQGAKL